MNKDETLYQLKLFEWIKVISDAHNDLGKKCWRMFLTLSGVIMVMVALNVFNNYRIRRLESVIESLQVRLYELEEKSGDTKRRTYD